MKDFICQREEEMESKCESSCDHCKEYYKPLRDFVSKTLTKEDLDKVAIKSYEKVM